MKKKFWFLILIIIFLYIIFTIISLKMYLPTQPREVPELTTSEKEEDFRYLTKYVHECYPYAKVVADIKKLDSIEDLSEQYIERAGKTTNNTEFLKLFLEYSQRLGQAGHYGIQWLNQNDYGAGYSFMFDLRKDAFLKNDYWNRLGSKLNLYTHSDMQVAYYQGKYFLTKEYHADGIILPLNTIIKSINGIVVDEYVRSLQDKQVLYFDNDVNKVYSHNLFITPPQNSESVWILDCLLPNGRDIEVRVNALNGYREHDSHINMNGQNILCTMLGVNVGYVCFATFNQAFKNKDKKILQEFMQASGSQLTKLILDVRGNAGGEPAYWMDNIIQPLLRNKVSLKEKTAVKRSYFNRMNLKYIYYRLVASNHLLKRKINHISDININEYKDAESIKWFGYELTKDLYPENSFPFTGSVYVLCDQDTISAGDSFIRAVKQLGIGTVVGAATAGWGNVFIQPGICALPNSGLMLRMDIEMPFGNNGEINSIYGTKPNVQLPPFNISDIYNRKTNSDKQIQGILKQDEWIDWILQDTNK